MKPVCINTRSVELTVGVRFAAGGVWLLVQAPRASISVDDMTPAQAMLLGRALVDAAEAAMRVEEAA